MLTRRLLLLLVPLALAAFGPDDAPPTTPEDQGAAAFSQALQKLYPTFQATDVRASPAADAQIIARLWPDVKVLVARLVAEGDWAEVQLPDGATGYVPADAIPAAIDDTPPELPETVSGHPIVRDTATLVIDRRNVHLYKLEGTDGPLADNLQKYISGAGGTVACAQQELGYYVCKTPDGTDLALVALVNGAAVAADGAPDDYQRQQQAAQQAHRGIWSTTVAAN